MNENELIKITNDITASQQALDEFMSKYDMRLPLPTFAVTQMHRLIKKHNQLVKRHNKLCPDFKVELVKI